MIKSVKLNEMGQVIEVEFDGCVSVRTAREVLAGLDVHGWRQKQDRDITPLVLPPLTDEQAQDLRNAFNQTNTFTVSSKG